MHQRTELAPNFAGWRVPHRTQRERQSWKGSTETVRGSLCTSRLELNSRTSWGGLYGTSNHGGALTQPLRAAAEVLNITNAVEPPAFTIPDTQGLQKSLFVLSLFLLKAGDWVLICFRCQMQTHGLKKQHWCNLHFLLFLLLSQPTTHITRSSLVSAAVSYTKGTSENLYGGNNMQFSSWTPFKM